MEQSTGWEGPGACCTDLNLTDSGGVRVSFPWRHFLDNPRCQGSIGLPSSGRGATSIYPDTTSISAPLWGCCHQRDWRAGNGVLAGYGALLKAAGGRTSHQHPWCPQADWWSSRAWVFLGGKGAAPDPAHQGLTALTNPRQAGIQALASTAMPGAMPGDWLRFSLSESDVIGCVCPTAFQEIAVPPR